MAMETTTSLTLPGHDLVDLTADTTIGLLEKSSVMISDESMYYINIYLNVMIRGIIAVFGMSNNLVNMVIFNQLGLKDSMSVGLMALSFTDFLVNLLGVGATGCGIWKVFFPDTAIDPYSVDVMAFGWVGDIIYQISGWVTTFLSIERCVCVVFPFKVKQIFTRLRSLIIVIIIYAVIFVVHMPVLVSLKFGWVEVEVETGNGTIFMDRLMIIYPDNWDQIIEYIDIANAAVLPFPSQALVVFSVVTMIVGLKLSSRVRTTTAVNSDAGDGKKAKLSEKEGRLVKVVIFLAVILTLCNIPRFLAAYAKQLFAGVTFYGQYKNMYIFLWYLAFLSSGINCSVNIFVYLIVNKSYRKIFKERLTWNKS